MVLLSECQCRTVFDMELPPEEATAAPVPDSVLAPPAAEGLPSEQPKPYRVNNGERIAGLARVFEENGITVALTEQERPLYDALCDEPSMPNKKLGSLLGSSAGAVRVAKLRLYLRLLGELPEDKQLEEKRKYADFDAQARDEYENVTCDKKTRATTISTIHELLTKHGIEPRYLSDAQKQLYESIIANPGASLKDICTQAGVSYSTVSGTLGRIIARLLPQLPPEVDRDALVESASKKRLLHEELSGNSIDVMRYLGRLLAKHGIDPLTNLTDSQRAVFELATAEPNLAAEGISDRLDRHISAVRRSLRSTIAALHLQGLARGIDMRINTGTAPPDEKDPSVADEIMGVLKLRMIARMAGQLGVEAAVLTSFFDNDRPPEETEHILEPLLALLRIPADLQLRLRARYADEIEDDKSKS